MVGSNSTVDGVIAQFELLASAASGRTLRVAAGGPGEPCWTDGRLVYVDDTLSEREQVAAILVQASLVSAGSLAPGVLRPLTRRARLAERYLTVEAHRALEANSTILPAMMHTLIDHTLAARSGSPAQSLSVARSRMPIGDAWATRGRIDARADRRRTTRRIAAPLSDDPTVQAGLIK